MPVLLQVRWLARLSDPAVRFVDKIIGEAVVSAGLRFDLFQNVFLPMLGRRARVAIGSRVCFLKAVQQLLAGKQQQVAVPLQTPLRSLRSTAVSM